MISREVRPLTDEEGAQLEAVVRAGAGPGFSRWFVALAGGPVAGMMLAGAIGALFGLTEGPIMGVVILSGAALGLVGGVLSLRAESRWTSEARQSDRQDLEDGQVEVLHCNVSDAVEVGEVEDDGPGFFLEVDDGQLLYLQGQHLIEFFAGEEQKAAGELRFPNREIEVLRLPHSGRLLDLRCLGEYFELSRVRGPLAQEEYLPEDGELVPAHLATLDEDLRRLERERGSRQRENEHT